MRKHLTHVLGALASVAIFVLALWALHHELRGVHLADVMAQFRARPPAAVALALALTAASHLVLTGYDFLAFRLLREPLGYARIALGSFIAFTVGNNVGLAVVSGGSMRYRIYSAAGVSGETIAKVIALVTYTFGIGVALVVGVVLVLEPGEAERIASVPTALARAIGWAVIAVVAGYAIWVGSRSRTFRIRGIELALPGAGVTLVQMLLAAADVALSASVLYVLLPPATGLSYPAFLGIYVLALMAGLASHVPGGIGVFETVLFLALPDMPKDALLGAVLAYRCIYYLVPLAIAALALAAHEFVVQRGHIARAGKALESWLAPVAPVAIGAGVIVAGAILLFSAAIPGLDAYAAQRIVPLPLLEVSHLLGSAIGLVLLVLARGLFRRLAGAWQAAMVAVGIGVVACLAKGPELVEVGILLVVMLVLWLSRSAFYRESSLLDERISAEWLATVAVILAGFVWLGLFAYRHVEYSDSLWWQFAFTADAPRFMRASVVVAVLAVALALWKLLHRMPPAPRAPDAASLERARALIAGCARADANLALAADKRLLFSDDGSGFLMYQVKGRSWVALGDPVGRAEVHAELIWAFRELCDRYDGWPIFYQVSADTLPAYIDMGLTALKLGEEARVALGDFSLEGKQRAGLRQSHRRAEREGASFEVLSRAQVADSVDEIEAVSAAWLADKHTAEKGFSVGAFSREYICEFPCAVARRGGRIVAFANVLESGDRSELSVDLMRHRRDAPPGVMDYMFVELMTRGRCEGFRWFSLGMAPLSGFEAHRLAPLWHRLGGLVFRHGEHFYNFEGLRQYKDKFRPIWTPRYLVSPGGAALPRMLVDIAALISGGYRRIVTK